ncbi:hypothetical protein P4U24_12370 [Aeribacillus composti]|nr:hypothetical protein [Aeribacillus composti]MED1442573.1 hypothetical protein [Aeribacillus composti]
MTMKVKEAGAFQIIKICKVEAMKIVIEITIEQYEIVRFLSNLA